MTATISEAPVGVELTHKGLISDQDWERLVGYIVKEKDMERALAERILDQALGFLHLVALSPGRTFCPSETVDIGWHAFLLHTREYAAFCERVNGQFIHHNPTDLDIIVPRTGGAAATVGAMKTKGLAVDEMLWAVVGDCDGDGSCDASSVCGGEGC